MIAKYIIKIILIFFLIFNVNAEEIKKIEITGNNRVSDETILLFGDIAINKEYSDSDLNKIIQNLFKTEFFENIKLKVENNTLLINVSENPIIQNVKISGVKNKRILKVLEENLTLKIM